MKAHIVKLPRAALVWGMEPGSAAFSALEQLCRAERIHLVRVDSSSAGRTVGSLCGIAGASAACQLLYIDPAAYPAALVVCGLQGDLEPFLDKVQAAEAAFALRAMVTAHNQSWSFAHLLDELLAEHTALNRPQEGAQ